MLIWSRRRKLQAADAELERRQSDDARNMVGQLYAQLAELFRDLPSVTGPRVVVGVGPKGGSGKTTTMVAASYMTAQLVTGDLILVDVNPDKSNLRERLVRAGRRGTLLDLIGALGSLRYPSQLAQFQVPVNRVKVIHKDGLRSADVQQVSAATWYELLETLSWYGQLVLADGGLSLVSPAAQGSLARADHVTLAVEADPVVIQKTLEAVNEVMASDPAIRDLMLAATVVVTYTNPTADLNPLLAESIEYLRRTFSGVFVVPYDPAAAVSGVVPFDHMATATTDAYLRVALHVAQCFLRPPRSTIAPAKPIESDSAPVDRPLTVNGSHSVPTAAASQMSNTAAGFGSDPSDGRDTGPRHSPGRVRVDSLEISRVDVDPTGPLPGVAVR